MTRLGILVTGVAVGLFSFACQRANDSSLSEKLEQIDKRLAGIESKLASGGGARAGAAGRQAPKKGPKGPDTKAVYSVDIQGDAFEGAADAKVTVVEAFEFA